MAWGGRPPSRGLRAVLSCGGTGNTTSPNDVSTGLRMGQATWFPTRIADGGAAWLFVGWEGSFPISALEPAACNHAQALDLQRLPAKRRQDVLGVRGLLQARPLLTSWEHPLGSQNRPPAVEKVICRQSAAVCI